MDKHLTYDQKDLLYRALISFTVWCVVAVWCFFNSLTILGVFVLLLLLPILFLPSALKRPQHPLSLPGAVLGGFMAHVLSPALFYLPALFAYDFYRFAAVAAGLSSLGVITGSLVGAYTASRWVRDRRLMNCTEKDWDRKWILQELIHGIRWIVVGLLLLVLAALSILMSILLRTDVLTSAAHVGCIAALYFILICSGTVSMDTPGTVLNRALLYMNQGSHSGDYQAMVWLEKILKKESRRHKEGSSPADPNHMDLLKYYVTLQMDLGYLRKAAAACKEGLERLEPASGENPDPGSRPLRRFFHETLFYCYGRLGKEEEKAASAISFLNLLPQSEELSRTDPETLCRLYTTSSAVMRENNDCKAALEYLNRAEALLKDEKEDSRRCYMEGLIMKERAAVLRKLDNAAEAEASLMTALSLFGSVTEEIPQNRSRVQAGLIYYTLAETRRTDGNFEEALRYYETALDIFEDRFGGTHFYAVDVYLGLADRYLAMGLEDDAAKYYRKAVDLLRAYTGIDSPDAIRAYRALADIYKEKRQMHKEKECLDHALDGYRAAGRIDDPEVQKINARINELMKHIGLGG